MKYAIYAIVISLLLGFDLCGQEKDITTILYDTYEDYKEPALTNRTKPGCCHHAAPAA